MVFPRAGAAWLSTGLAAIPDIATEMDLTTITILGILTLLVLIVLSGFFSSSEIAMFSLPAHRVDGLVAEGAPGSEVVAALKDNPHRLLVTILVGNNLVNIAMSSLATGLLALYFSQAVAVAIATFGITAIVLLFGEAAPKSYAVENTESWSLRIARPLKLSEYVLYPLVVLFDYLTRKVNQALGTESPIESPYATRSEIQQLLEAGEEEGVIEEDEHEMLRRIFRFTEIIAKEVMTPRLDIDAVSTEESIEDAIQTCVQSNHERLPVFDGNLDNVIGTVELTDLIRESEYGERDGIDLEDIVNPTLHVPESKNVDELLREMRESRIEMVIVIDEFGTTEGLITVEDLVEEVVGEILEGGEEEPIEEVSEDIVVARGEVNIHEINEVMDLELPEGEEFETIAGFIFNRVGRLVDEGEQITYDNIDITVEEVDNTRIMKARIERTGPPREEEPTEDQPSS